ncbi:transcription factor TFIIIB component B-like protein [Labeo rohita]|uniref:Transcription factor TFIIIB component B-like protein n=1 Tax=Labeo rohita TaxID=84645 RepID=A0A498M1K2_LABRO|nr:transcription factor TFIIIB component B-like protein [Labeo rohita]
MIRRSRISVRPNVKPTGRAQTPSQNASVDNVQLPPASADLAPSEGSEVTAEKLKTDPPIAALEQTNEDTSQNSCPSDQLETSKHGEDAASKSSDAQDSTSTSATSGPQRRKRFTALPNLAKPRASAKTSKSPSKSLVKPVTPSEPETSTPTEESSHQIPEPVNNPRLPGRRRPSGGGRQAKVQPIPTAPLQNDRETEPQEDGASEDTLVPLTVQQGESKHPHTNSQPDTVLVHEKSPVVGDVVVQQESDSGSPLGQSQLDLLRERLNKLKTPSKILNSLKSLNDPADMVRLAQARKLRELLKKEMNKQKEDKKKPKMGIRERKAPKDHTKMTMRELIYYLPVSNPMKSFTEEEQKASETVIDDASTPTSSKSPAAPPVQETVVEDAGHEEDEERMEETQPEEEEPLLVPRVKVAEDGSLIIDEESLTVQVSRTKGPNPAEDRDPIFERGSTTTYSSFRKGTYTKPWSNGETEMFYLAISMVGTDFSMIGQLFPHRARMEIKNKFKKEERNNSWRIDKAFKEKRRLDLDFFKNLMEQILKNEEKKKSKNKELVKLAKAQRRVQRKVRAAKRREMDSSTDSESDVVAGEKENEDLSNDGGSDTTPKKRRRKGVNTEEERRDTNGEAAIDEPEGCENLPSDGQSQDDRYKSPAIKPAQLKGRPQRPIPNLSRKWGNRRPMPKTNVQEDGTSAGEENKMDKSPKVPSPSIKEKKRSTVLLELEDLEEEPDLTAVQEQIFNKPTRSGRIPKLSQHVIQAAAEEEEDEDELSDLPVSSKVRGQAIKAPGRRSKLKPGPRLKQGMPRRGKSRLVTLLASGTEDDEEEGEEEEAEECALSQEDFPSNPEEENQAFVPRSLRPVLSVNSEVVETMEELDISVNESDILGTSQNALCHELSCEQATVPAGPVPCENHLDLLVDVIEFLDPDHMEVCKEINNEAAHTLLTIGNSAQMIQTSEMPSTSENDIVEQSSIVHEEVVHEEVITETPILSGPSISCESETKGDVELKTCETHIPEPSTEETSTQNEEPIKSKTTEAHPAPIQPETQVPPSKRGRFSKPKPNIGQGLRTRQVLQQQICPELVTVSAEQDKNSTQPMQEHSVPVDHLPDSSTIHPEVLQLNTSSERTEDSPKVIPERVTKEDNGSVSSLKRKNDDIIIDENKKEQEEARSEPQLTKSASDSQSTSDETSKLVRRYRGPKPKPNLTQISRRTETQHSTTSTTIVLNEKLPAAESSITTFTKSPEEGAVVTTEPDVSEIEDVTTVVSKNKSRQKTTVTLNENNGTVPEEVCEDSTVKHPGCVSKNTSAEPTPEEPVFILSLTEIPPTLDEGVGFRTERLPPAAASESHSHGQSASESREVSHLLITDALIPVSEDEEKKSEQRVVDKSAKGEVKRKAPASTSQGTRSVQEQTVPAVISSTDDSISTSNKTHSPVPEESVQEGPSHGIMGGVGTSGKETNELSSGSDSQGVSQITPVATSGPLTRPGRRPKGFLSFISSKSTQGPSEAPRGAKPGPQKPTVNTSRPERKRIAGPVTTAGDPSVKRPSPTPASTTASVIEDCEVQKRIEREVRIREGACKLLAACSQRDQALEASKTLLTSNSRILALMTQLQRMKEAQAMQKAGRRSSDGGPADERLPCTGKVAISNIRIPLMWKDSEYFKNKGELHQCAVFCLLQIGTEIHDTDLVIVDRTLTDICFDEPVIFTDVPPGFDLRVELYSCCVEEEFSMGFSTRRLSRLGSGSSKKFMATLEIAASCGSHSSGTGSGGSSPGGESPVLLPALSVRGPKYHLLAHTSLSLCHIQNSFRTHDLTISDTETNPEDWKDVYGVLSGSDLKCYQQQDNTDSLETPLFTIPINKDTRVRATERDPALHTHSITISNQCGVETAYTILTYASEDTHNWMEAFWQHFYDMSQWKQCCNELMKIEEPSPKKMVAVTKQGSLYHEMVTQSSTQSRNHLSPLNRPVSSEIRSLLSTYYNDR